MHGQVSVCIVEVEVSAMLNHEIEFSFAPFVCVALVVLCSLGVMIDTASRYEPPPPVRWDGTSVIIGSDLSDGVPDDS